MPDQAVADEIVFGDSVNYWPGFQSNATENALDVRGTPNITGGTVSVMGDMLLLGSGLIGVAGVGRKKFKKKS
jgi:hypothetical protein